MAGMTTKQKVTGIAFLVVVVIIIWQVKGLFSSSTPPAPVVKPATTMNTATPGSPAPTGMPGAPNMPSPMPPQPLEQARLPEPPTNLDASVLENQKKAEQKYIEQLNQLQMLKVQRDIAETNQAIATAKLATITAEKNVSDILTKPMVQQFPQGAYGPGMVNPVAPGTPIVRSTTTTTTPAPVEAPPPVEPQFAVVSVSMQQGRWSAVLGYQGKLYNVSIGDVVPVDGSVVVSINRNGVVLSKQGTRKRINIVSSI